MIPNTKILLLAITKQENLEIEQLVLFYRHYMYKCILYKVSYLYTF
jgi:hypothetical protein